VAQIHDELLFEVDVDYVDVAAEAVRLTMSRAMSLAVPTPVKISVGPNWGSMRDIDAASTPSAG
jgi:DNA polymerase theta